MTYETTGGEMNETPSIEESNTGGMASAGMADELPGYVEWLDAHDEPRDIEAEYQWWLKREAELATERLEAMYAERQVSLGRVG